MWTSKEIQELIRLYPNNFNYDIAIILNKSESAIDNKSFRLKLKKNKEFHKKNGALNNKYDINTLSEIAKKYKTKIDFINSDKPAYYAALRRGILKDITTHMLPIKYSTPQLILRNILDKLLPSKSIYNDRKTIKPYEIDVYYPDFKLGFEYQGIYWHKDDDKDIKKRTILKEKGINIIYIYENTRDYINDIKKQLLNLLPELNKICDLKLSEENINNCLVDDVLKQIYNKDELIAITRKYETFKEFKINEPSVYTKLLKMGLVDFATSHMPDKISRYKTPINEIEKLTKKYIFLSDFRKNEPKLYKHIKRVKLEYLLVNLKHKTSFTKEEILETINKYEKKCDFINDNPKMYRFIRRNGITQMLSHLSRCSNKK